MKLMSPEMLFNAQSSEWHLRKSTSESIQLFLPGVILINDKE